MSDLEKLDYWRYTNNPKKEEVRAKSWETKSYGSPRETEMLPPQRSHVSIIRRSAMATRQHPQPEICHIPGLLHPPQCWGSNSVYRSPLEGSVIDASTGQVITKESRAETRKYVFWFQSPCLFLLPQTGSSRCDERWQQPHSLPLESRMSLWQKLGNMFGKVVPRNLSSELREYTYGDQVLWQRYVSSRVYIHSRGLKLNRITNALEKLAASWNSK